MYGAPQIALLSQDLQLDEVHCAELLLYAHEQVSSMGINLCSALQHGCLAAVPQHTQAQLKLYEMLHQCLYLSYGPHLLS